MAVKPKNEVVGGTVLRRAAIESPNFVAGSTGWIIRQDGSAEFNNVIIRNGQVISGTALYYDPSPGLGNLVASVAAKAGTDAFGQPYLLGVTVYQFSPGLGFATQVNTGGEIVFYTSTGAGNAWSLGPVISTDSTGDLALASRVAKNITLSTNGGIVISDFIAFNNGGAEVWHAPGFVNSWANAGAPGANLQYRLVAAPYNSMQWAGRLTAPAGIAGNQAITTAVPAAYRPAHTQPVYAINVTTGAAVRLSFGSTGVLTYQSGAAVGDTIDLGGLISLDA